MTLEKKIKLEADEKSQVYYDDRKYVAHTQFSDGAKWMLSELKPVMDEMRKLLDAVVDGMEWEADNNPADMEKSDFEHLERAKQALSKYNELFKK